MRFRQTRDVIQHAQAFHLAIGERYHQLSEESERQRLKILLDYLSDRERMLAASLEQFTEETSQGLLDTWFQFEDDEQRMKWPDCQLPTEVTSDTVLNAGLALTDCFIKLYREIATSADSEKVRQVFRNLMESEEQEKRTLARNVQMLDDL